MPTETPEDMSEEPLPKKELDETADLREQLTQLTSELKKANADTEEISKQVTKLEKQLEKTKIKNSQLSEELSETKNQVQALNREKTDLTDQISELEEQLAQTNTKLEKKHKKIKELQGEIGKTKDELTTAQQKLNEIKKISSEREEYMQGQMEAMAEQIEKHRVLIKKRDEELIELQKDILVKKDAARDAEVEASQLRTVGIVQREAVQDTTVLKRRVTDLEVELEQLKKALEKDPKYRIYILVRETGQRTLEELSKVLGVGIFEARRRVQELVRAGLLELKDDRVFLAK